MAISASAPRIDSPRPQVFRARKLVVATGYYDLPNYLGIPGEDLSKVHHYYNEPHPFFGLEVLVIGGKNSAAIAAARISGVTGRR